MNLLSMYILFVYYLYVTSMFSFGWNREILDLVYFDMHEKS